VVDAVMAILRVSKDEAIRVIRKHQTGRVLITTRVKTRRRRVPMPRGMGHIEGPHRRYLRSRGFNRRDLTLWNVQATRHMSGKWNWRLVYPIRNRASEIVAWQGRSISAVFKPKYQTTPRDDCLEEPESFLYGIHEAKGDYIFVVEGAFDVWRFGAGTVGLLGSNWHNQQANVLRGYRRRFIMLDSDDPLAQKKAIQLAEWLSLFPGETEIIEELPCDPAGLSRREVSKLRKKLLGGSL